MKYTLILLLFFYLEACSQKYSDDGNCIISNNELIIVSEEAADTVYVKVYAKHNIDNQFQKTDALRLSYSYTNTNDFSDSIDIDKNNTEINDKAYVIYEIIEECLDKYSKITYDKEIKRIEKLKQKGIAVYNYYVFVKIYPQ
ncbi:MAG: hypothetical protein ACQESK_04365 [Bacteroidota bacterium]